jgi:RNA polymerase sigma-70 factor (ECF subfamily)
MTPETLSAHRLAPKVNILVGAGNTALQPDTTLDSEIILTEFTEALDLDTKSTPDLLPEPAIEAEPEPEADDKPDTALEAPEIPAALAAARENWKLVKRAQAGDESAFSELYLRYYDTVYKFIYYRTGRWEQAQDLTSDTFLRALRRIGSVTWQGKDFGAWLITIARNLIADHHKSGRSRLEVSVAEMQDDRADFTAEGNPELATIDHLSNVTLLTAVKQLNDEQQRCIILRFLNGFSVAETAEAMGKNVGAIKALQYRAVRTLNRILSEEGIGALV